MKMNTLQDWVDQSPNASTTNVLIETLGVSGGRVVYRSYRWRNKTTQQDEPDVYVSEKSGRIISQENAHSLLLPIFQAS